MRLLTHNSLRCGRNDVTSGYPLKIIAEAVEVHDSPCNREFITELLSSLNWAALRSAALELGIDTLPEALTDECAQETAFIDAVHHILMDVHVIEGQLICPESGQVFPVANGIANMLYV